MGWPPELRYPRLGGRALNHPGRRLSVKVYLRHEASGGCQKVGERAYLKVQLLWGGGLGDLPISRVRARYCGTNPGGLGTPPTARRWDPRQLPKVGGNRGAYLWPLVVRPVPWLFQQSWWLHGPCSSLCAPGPCRCLGMTLAATPFALDQLVVGCGC